MTDDRQDNEGIELEGMDRLIQEDIEGTISPNELRELGAYLAAHPEAVAEREAQGALAAHLDGIPLAEPPSWIQDRVMSEIHDEAADTAPIRHLTEDKKPEGTWTSLRPPMGGWFTRRPVFGFAFGAVAGMLALALLTGRGGIEDPQGLRGAMTSPTETVATSVIDRVAIDAGGIQGVAETTRDGDQVTLDFSLDSPTAAEFTVRFAPGDLGLVGFERDGASIKPVTLGTDAISGAGTGHYRIRWEAADTPSDLHLEITAAGRRLVRRIRTGP